MMWAEIVAFTCFLIGVIRGVMWYKEVRANDFDNGDYYEYR